MRDCSVKQFLQMSCNWEVVLYVGAARNVREIGDRQERSVAAWPEGRER